MDELDPTKKDLHDGTEIIAKKKLDKFLGIGRKPFKNATLFGIDMETYEIYEVKMNTEKVVKIETVNGQQKDVVHSKVYINDKHRFEWALNKQNALKKFLKIKIRV